MDRNVEFLGIYFQGQKTTNIWIFKEKFQGPTDYQRLFFFV